MRPSAPPRVRPSDLALFATLYALQGVVFAYFFNFNQGYMTVAGVPRLTAAGVQSVALVPFVLKFLAGPLSDRLNLFGFGHRRPYIVVGLGLQSLGLLALARLDPGRQLAGFTAVAIATVAGLALYDTCCDGMVIDVTPPDDRARVQGLLVAARALAAMAGSLGFGLWLGQAGEGAGAARFHRVLWVCAALGLVPLAQVVRLPEPRKAAETERYRWGALRALVAPRALALLAFGALYSVVGYGVEINLSPYYTTLGFREGSVGGFAAVRYLGRAAGAALLTLASRSVGRPWVLAIGILALAATTACQAAIGGGASAGALAFAFGAANGWDDAVFFVLAMEASDPRMAASTYALFMAVTNLSVAGGWLFSASSRALGDRDPPTFLAAGLASLVALAFLPALGRPTPRPALAAAARSASPDAVT